MQLFHVKGLVRWAGQLNLGLFDVSLTHKYAIDGRGVKGSEGPEVKEGPKIGAHQAFHVKYGP